MAEKFTEKAIAHVKQIRGDTWDDPHLLEDHLRDVGEMAKNFAEGFGSDDWAETAGQLHDLGKYQDAFLKYIVRNSGYDRSTAHMEQYQGRVTHSTAGALHAINKLGGLGYALAYMITGHHSGLPDGLGDSSSLVLRLANGKSEYAETMKASIPEDILTVNEDLMPPIWAHDEENIHIWIRMLFSCLVDADFLDTESYMTPVQSFRRPEPVLISDVYQHYMQGISEMLKKADATDVNRIRSQILEECLSAAEQPPGMFSLTVPTGGGKTLSSLAFALKHAEKYGKNRVIYAIPFTSIIEQNADVFRSFLKEEWVLEHHSSIDPEKETPMSRLATENWDQPVVVTTNVQLFESLFAYKTSQCRKLHNIANSVIVIDEAQQIPRDFHKPITDMMQYLSDNFGVTWVLCTATQPVLDKDIDVFGKVVMPGINNVREIMTDPEHLSNSLKRVDINFPKTDERLSWPGIASAVYAAPSVLAVVNTKRDAVNLYESLPEQGDSLFLSANMCQIHRKKVLAEVRERLKRRRSGDERPVRLISTQLIEAGVDLDFPVVFRAMAGLDSIAQAAGRCNREGKMKGMGRVVVFHPPNIPPDGLLRQSADVTTMLLRAGQLKEPLSGKSFRAYFTELNQLGDRDAFDVCRQLTAISTEEIPIGIQFRRASDSFSMIDKGSVSVLLPYESCSKLRTGVFKLLDEVEENPQCRITKRKLQQYAVSMPQKRFDELVELKGVSETQGFWVVSHEYHHPVFGLNVR